MDEATQGRFWAGSWQDALTHQDRVRAAFAAYSKPLTQFLVSLGLPMDSAQDVLQDTFIAYLEELEKGVDIMQVRPWLFRVSSRIAMRNLRLSRSEVAHDPESLVELLDRRRLREPDGEMFAIEQQQERDLLSAIQNLSPQQKLCLHLRSEGLKYREIAEVLGVSIPTVAEFLRRAIARLRSILYA